jgi:hypothetical protein
MADKWVAVGEIKYGDKDAKSKADAKYFQGGDVVSGLDKETMDRLIESGSVIKAQDYERREAPEGESDLEVQYREVLKAKDNEIAELRAKLADAEEKQNTPAGGQGAQTPAAKK